MIKIVSINFDSKTKIIMCISIVIAICIIAYNFYNICIRNDDDIITKAEFDFSKIVYFESESEITVNSNKNSNVYRVHELSSLEENKYNYKIDNELEIDINNDEIRISNFNIENDYITANQYLEKYNYMSIASIIKLFNEINNQSIEGKISRVTQNNETIYKLYFNDKKVKYIEIYLNENNLKEIKIFEDENKELYYIKINSFIVKKFS